MSTTRAEMERLDGMKVLVTLHGDVHAKEGRISRVANKGDYVCIDMPEYMCSPWIKFEDVTVLAELPPHPHHRRVTPPTRWQHLKAAFKP